MFLIGLGLMGSLGYMIYSLEEKLPKQSFVPPSMNDLLNIHHVAKKRKTIPIKKAKEKIAKIAPKEKVKDLDRTVSSLSPKVERYKVDKKKISNGLNISEQELDDLTSAMQNILDSSNEALKK